MSDIAAQIREARRARGLSQERLARLADCSFISIRHFEHGLVPTRSNVLPRVLEVLGLNVDREPDT
jgi:transcriptional regulator with XRE-family HTH domain